MAPAASNSSSNLRRSYSLLPNLLLWLLNLSLVLAAAALGLVFLLRPRSTPFGYALVSVHATTLLSALVSSYAHLTHHHCLPAQAFLVVAALCGHALTSYALFIWCGRTLALLRSARDRREQLVLVFLEKALLLGMFLVQAVAATAYAVGRR